MIALGIETSCDETSVAVTSGSRVLSNVVTSSVRFHKKYGGVVPEIASRYHVEYIVEVFEKALFDAHKTIKDLDLIAVTNGPGLVGALFTGLSFAKSLAYAHNIPLIGVNHIFAHLYSAVLTEHKAVKFPFIGLVISGGHTAIFYCKDVDDQVLLGQTQDDAVGEAYDKVAKLLGLGYPGGPIVDRMAHQAKRKHAITFPKSMMGNESYDFSYSGIKTAVLYYVQKNPHPDPDHVRDICHAFQEAALSVLVEKVCRAALTHKVNTIIVGGGVAANSRLREMLSDPAKTLMNNRAFNERFYPAASRSELQPRGRQGGICSGRLEATGLQSMELHNKAISSLKCYFPALQYCMDNGAMISALGEALYKKGYVSDLYLNAEPNLEIAAC